MHKEKERHQGAQEAGGRSGAHTGYDLYWDFCGRGQAGLGGQSRTGYFESSQWQLGYRASH